MYHFKIIKKIPTKNRIPIRPKLHAHTKKNCINHKMMSFLIETKLETNLNRVKIKLEYERINISISLMYHPLRYTMVTTI